MDNKRATVMIVDDNLANLKVARNALSESCDVFAVPSAAKMFDLLRHNRPNLILLDVEMPEMDGLEAIKILKANPHTQSVPVIFLTGQGSPESELKGLSLGAIDYISKPFMPQILHKRVNLHLTVEAQRLRLEEQAINLEAKGEELKYFNQNLQKMVEEKTSEVFKLQGAILSTVVNLVERRDDATGGHVARTQHILRTLIYELNNVGLYRDQMLGWDINLILQSSQLHDVGKIAIADSILNKPGRLTVQEFAEMQKHAALGADIIERIEAETLDSEFLKYAKIFARTHHEKWDGSGYPYGLAGEDIPLPGRLMAIADVYDAVNSKRPYKEAASHQETVQIILEGRGRHFDPFLVDVFELIAEQLDVSARYSLKKPFKP